MSDGPPRLAVRGLSHAYGQRRVLSGVDLEVAPGEMVGLLGPNGSGKSTVLSALQGLLRPDAGEVMLDGVTVSPGSPALRAALGVVPQDVTLFNESVRYNLRYGSPDASDAQVEAAARPQRWRWLVLPRRRCGSLASCMHADRVCVFVTRIPSSIRMQMRDDTRSRRDVHLAQTADEF